MRTRLARTAMAAFVVMAGGIVAGQQPAGGGPPAGQGQNLSPLPLTGSLRERGSGVTPALEGWYHGNDGSDYILVGYFNRNSAQEIDVPVGPNNHIDPGGPDYGQPTHFLTGRQMGVFTVKVPKDFGNKKLQWTLIANGLTNSITLQTFPVYIVEPYKASWNNATPPTVKFAPSGPGFTGPPQGIAITYMDVMPTPLTLTTYYTPGDVGERGGGGTPPPPTPTTAARGGRGVAAGGATAAAAGAAGAGGRGAQAPITWTMSRGAGHVTFANATPAVDAANGGKSETTATFDAPGDYVLRVQGGTPSNEQCCWTSANVKVTVKPAAK